MTFVVIGALRVNRYFANSEDPDEMLYNAALHQDLQKACKITRHAKSLPSKYEYIN